MGSVFVVFFDPGIEIELQLLQRSIDLLAERDPVELIQHRLVKPLADPIGLGMPGLGACVMDILDRQIEFIFMALGRPRSTRSLDRSAPD